MIFFLFLFTLIKKLFLFLNLLKKYNNVEFVVTTVLNHLKNLKGDHFFILFNFVV